MQNGKVFPDPKPPNRAILGTSEVMNCFCSGVNLIASPVGPVMVSGSITKLLKDSSLPLRVVGYPILKGAAMQITKPRVKTLFSTSETAEALGVSERRIRQMCTRGQIGEQIGGKVWIIRLTEILREQEKRRIKLGKSIDKGAR